MRWQPDEPVCSECGFDWSCARDEATAIVAASAQAAEAALSDIADPSARTGRRWSASMYLWHVVDVLRIGTERLLTLQLDPDRGIPCWDENGLADARRYERLSPVVGIVVLEQVAAEWSRVAAAVADEAEVRHPLFGTLRTVDVIRRNAHEVRHHLYDIRQPTPS